MSDEIDKSRWPLGPWHAEPDRLEFQIDGFPCLIVRQRRTGHLCGYLAVPPGHPWHGRDYSQSDAAQPGVVEPSVHGGVTYADKCADDICHIPKPGEPDDVWWLGFDCMHSGDLVPSTSLSFFAARRPSGFSYKTIAYVTGELESLARQATAVGAKS